MQDGTTESVCKMGQQSQCARQDNRVSVHDRIRQCVKWDNRVSVQDGTTVTVQDDKSLYRMEDARWNNRVSVQDGTIESVCTMGQMSQCTRWDNRVSVYPCGH